MVKRTCVLILLLVWSLASPVRAQTPTPLPPCTSGGVPVQLLCMHNQVQQVAYDQASLQQTLVASMALLTAGQVMAAPLPAGSVITGTLPSGGEVALRYEFTVGDVVLILFTGIVMLLLVLEVLHARLRGRQ